MVRPHGSFAPALSLTALAACSNTTPAATAVIYTDVYVEPGAFESGARDASSAVLCSDRSTPDAGPPSLRSYVATLFDVTAGEPSPGLELASTAPTQCSLRAAFGQVIPGHAYIGVVEGYDLPACEGPGVIDDVQGNGPCIRPISGPGSGTRTMVDDQGAVRVPIWTWTCGAHRLAAEPQATGGDPLVAAAGLVPTMSVADYQVPLTACVLVSGPEPSGDGGTPPSSIVVDLGSIVVRSDGSTSTNDGGAGALCAADSGFRDIEVTLGDATTAATCDDPLVRFDAPAGRAAIHVAATASDGSRWGAHCSATAKAGTTAYATCDPLSSQGALVVPAALVRAAAPQCVSWTATLEASPPAPAASCSADVTFASLPPGAYAVKVEAKNAANGDVHLACQGTVVAGEATPVTCTP